MRALPFLLGVMGLLVTVAAHAAEIDCRYVTLSLPDDRSVVERPSTDSDGLRTAIFGKEDRIALFRAPRVWWRA